MANLLILSLVFPPDNVSTAHIMGELALDLKEKGHHVRVISTVPHYNRDSEALADHPLRPYWGKLLQRSRYFGIDVMHVWMPRKGKNLLLRMVSWLGFHVISIFAGMPASFRPEIILAPSPPLTIGISAWLLGWRHRCPFVYNVQEIYPDVAVDLGVIKNRVVIRFLRKLERFVYAKAAALAVISSGMADRLRLKGVPEGKIRVIPNFVDVEDFAPLPKDNPFARRHGLHDRFVVSYAGNMGKPQGLDALLEAAAALRDEDGIHFLLMGDGSERESLIAQARRLRLARMTLLPHQPYSLMGEAYAAADASFVSQAPGTCHDGIPSKAYRILACARPVIACTDQDSDLARLVKQADGGVIVPPGDALALADAIRDIFLHREAWMERGRSARSFIIRNYSRSAISGLYHEMLIELQPGKARS